jgi:hypothetical protein
LPLLSRFLIGCSSRCFLYNISLLNIIFSDICNFLCGI